MKLVFPGSVSLFFCLKPVSQRDFARLAAGSIACLPEKKRRRAARSPRRFARMRATVIRASVLECGGFSTAFERAKFCAVRERAARPKAAVNAPRSRRFAKLIAADNRTSVLDCASPLALFQRTPTCTLQRQMRPFSRLTPHASLPHSSLVIRHCNSASPAVFRGNAKHGSIAPQVVHSRQRVQPETLTF